MKKYLFILAIPVFAIAAQDVFDMQRLYPQHRQLLQEMMQAVRAGKIEDMETAARKAIEVFPQDATWHYNLACALAYHSDKAESLAMLERAIDLGFRDPKAMESDRDLKYLTNLPQFKTLLDKAAKLQGKPVEGAPQPKASTLVMGFPAKVDATNTIFDFDAGYFRTLFNLMPPSTKKIAGYASDYTGPSKKEIEEWMTAGTASGNFGDLYVNRDNGHSALVTTNFPGLTPVVYGEDAKAKQVNIGLPNANFGYPVIGNASIAITAGPYWRSMPRAIQTDQVQPIISFQLMLANQCWFYPAHRDFTAETGDLYPVNTPYYIISKGSSTTDLPFMQAVTATMAAFRPETKQALISRGLLVPTLQMILRATQKTIKTPDDYLTGLAHPVVFDSANLNVDAMVRLSHELTPQTIPAPTVLRTLKDAKTEIGIDYFDLRTEGLFDTPFAIARIIRGVRTRTRSMTIEAMVPGLPSPPSPFIWKVLQGDPAKITIKPLTPNASQVEITLAYHGIYRPTPGAWMTSRVDIGCFLKTGERYAMPSIVSFSYLPNEERLYRDDGNIQSVDYMNANHRYSDPVLTMPKTWKDLYDYDSKAQFKGWYRTKRTGAPERFTYAGHKVLGVDKLNRPIRACSVQYMPRQQGENRPPELTYVDSMQQVFVYSYSSDDDVIGTFKQDK
jgi:hypothetical protein